MNFLAHLYIAEATETSLAGALLGDFVRGRLDGRLAPDLEAGIRLHRRVDSYTDGHPVVLAAFARLAAPYRRYAGILVDIYFDHILARDWPQFHQQSLATFSQRAENRVQHQWPQQARPFPPERLTGLAARLCSYRHADGIADALAGLDRRLSRPSPLARALPVLQEQDRELSDDFRAFFPELLAFARTRPSR